MNSNKIKSAVVVFGMALLCSTSSFAQGQRGGEQKERPTFAKLITEMDANEDGKLAKDELKGPLKENFAKIDTDEDGFISEEEFDKAPKPKRGPKR